MMIVRTRAPFRHTAAQLRLPGEILDATALPPDLEKSRLPAAEFRDTGNTPVAFLVAWFTYS